MNREIIDKVFRRDFRKLLQFDIFELTDDVELLVEKEWFDELLIEPVTKPIRTLYLNLIELVVKYLEYDPERFPNPVDQYIFIYEQRDTILEVLGRNMEQKDPFNDPVGYAIWFRMNARFERVFAHILTIANTHKFDPEIIERQFGRDGDEPEET